MVITNHMPVPSYLIGILLKVEHCDHRSIFDFLQFTNDTGPQSYWKNEMGVLPSNTEMVCKGFYLIKAKLKHAPFFI